MTGSLKIPLKEYRSWPDSSLSFLYCSPTNYCLMKMFIPFLILIFVCYSCRKIAPERRNPGVGNNELSAVGIEGFGSCVDPMENDLDTTDSPTILGPQLLGNPYSLTVMQQASFNLYGTSAGISINKLYVKFRPLPRKNF